ncbi:uncharacterized protein LOC726677 isoform X1 [Apis mellifera]|uniref:Uncharacterized protein LOC726677 isoform X1 n=1 Tax=Apis mellifera TaxID=7460 RepID=A0A7M7MT96_APIME|nr:uncharacterized protein LOC726677 isoform X1 [Apis mellifera]|eukprot:XP_026300527.1 uncharacterized protein LOC726677 isoform X1 [Apis mellifera]
MVKNGTGPVIRMSSTATHAAGGVECCFCRCCTCIHLEFLKTLPGVLKLCETIISGLIQSLLINYGLRYSTTIGSAFEGSLTTSSACFLTSAVLLACYIVSEKSYRLIKSSLFLGFLFGILHQDISSPRILYKARIRCLSCNDSRLHYERLCWNTAWGRRVFLLHPLQDRKMNSRGNEAQYKNVTRIEAQIYVYKKNHLQNGTSTLRQAEENILRIIS